MTFWLSCCCLLLWMLQWSCCNANLQHKYCIIGAGPSGIQLAYYFQKWKLDYILLERSHQPGNFYSNYPRHGKLISINKRFTGEMNSEFNLRHDWNSLLTDLNLEAHSQDAFQSFSEELFPTRDQMMQYLTAFVQRHQLRVQFQFNVTNLSRLSEGAGFLLEDGGSSSRIACNIAIVAIGMNQPNIPNAQGMEWTVGYEQVSTNGRDFANQKVLILGAGNAAFETAASLYEHTAVVHIGTHNRIRLAWATHYVGDLRAVNNPLLDTYLLKSLDAVVNVEVNDQLIIQKLADNRLQVIDLQDGKFINSSEFVYDSIVRCLGWRFDDSLFNKSSVKVPVQKYPNIRHDYRSELEDHLYFAGTITHSLDHRKSAGGFIHGFRYTVRALSRILRHRYENVPWPSSQRGVEQLLDHLVRRINEGSGNYQMFGILADVIILSQDHTEYVFLEEYPLHLIPEVVRYTGVTNSSLAGGLFVVTFQYGYNFSGPDKNPFNTEVVELRPWMAYRCNFLHPVLHFYDRLPSDMDFQSRSLNEALPRADAVHHIVEDLHTNFRNPQDHVLPLQRFLETTLQLDLQAYSSQQCLFMALTASAGVMSPPACKQPMDLTM